MLFGVHFDPPDGVPKRRVVQLLISYSLHRKYRLGFRFFIVVSFLSPNEVGIKSVLINYCILRYVCNGLMLIGMPYTVPFGCVHTIYSAICPISLNIGNLIYSFDAAR
jgi:hypothetical protein